MRRTLLVALLVLPAVCFPLWLVGCSGDGGADPFAIQSGSTLTRILDRKELLVGMEVEFKPFEFKNEKNEAVGFDVDLARGLAAGLGVELKIVEMKFSGIFGSLTSGKVDIALSGITATLERAQIVAFSRPYYRTGLCLLVAKESTIQSHEDLDDAGITIAVKKGTTGMTVARERYTKATIKEFEKESLCALEVAQGKADVFIYDFLTLREHQRSHADTTRLIPELFTFEPYAIAFRQGEPDLARFIDQYLWTIENDGRLASMRKRWLETD